MTSDGRLDQDHRGRAVPAAAADRHGGVRRLPDRVAPRPPSRLRPHLHPVRAPAVRRARPRPTASGSSSASACSAAPRSRCSPGSRPRRRAMAPITRLTDVARSIARTRDPSLRIPHPESEDEVAELARTLEGMLLSLDERARRDGGGARAPARVRRRRLARAAHAADLRAGQPRAAGGGAGGRAARGGRVRAALVAPHAPPRRRPAAARPRGRRAREAPHVPLDLVRGVDRGGRRARAGGRRPPDQRLGAARRARSRAPATSCTGSRSTCSRTRCATPTRAPRSRRRWSASTARSVLSVEDDGPGIPPELRDKVFERFFRGAGDRSGSSGLGLAIVRAVAAVAPRRRARWSRRSTGAAPASWCVFPHR